MTNEKREGPLASIELSCSGCAHLTTRTIEEDFGPIGLEIVNRHYCGHPDSHNPRPDGTESIRYIGGIASRTPDWCPLRARAIDDLCEAHGYTKEISIDVDYSYMNRAAAEASKFSSVPITKEDLAALKDADMACTALTKAWAYLASRGDQLRVRNGGVSPVISGRGLFRVDVDLECDGEIRPAGFLIVDCSNDSVADFLE